MESLKMATKKTLGRRRIEIKKLENKSNKQVTFSKRRNGLFKKAGELSVLCGAEVAVIVFSPNDKVFCFGHPSVDAVIHRFSAGSSSSPEPVETYVPMAEFNRQYNELLKVLEMEKNKLRETKEAVNDARRNGIFWWDERVEAMGLEDLQQYRTALMELRRKVGDRALAVGGYLLPPLPPSLQTPVSFPGADFGIGNPSVGTEGGGGEACVGFLHF